MSKSTGTFGIDGDKFYLLWGDNLQTGHSFFADTIGEIRDYHLKYANRPLKTGNNIIDVLMHKDKTAKEYSEVYATV